MDEEGVSMGSDTPSILRCGLSVPKFLGYPYRRPVWANKFCR